jgi:hypothetical protein
MASCGMVSVLAASCSTFSFCHEGSPEPEPEQRWRVVPRGGSVPITMSPLTAACSTGPVCR